MQVKKGGRRIPPPDSYEELFLRFAEDTAQRSRSREFEGTAWKRNIDDCLRAAGPELRPHPPLFGIVVVFFFTLPVRFELDQVKNPVRS